MPIFHQNASSVPGGNISLDTEETAEPHRSSGTAHSWISPTSSRGIQPR